MHASKLDEPVQGALESTFFLKQALDLAAQLLKKLFPKEG
jgi:hypothetical protein